jgi:Tol biopolymer transport system component
MGIYLVRLDVEGREPIVVTRVSAPEGEQSVSPAVNSDGRFIAFMSKADESTRHPSAVSPEPPDGNSVADIYLRDSSANTTTRLTRSHKGRDANGRSYHPAISGDGRYIAFASEASNLTPRVRRGTSQIYVHDRVTGLTELVTGTGRGRGGNADSRRPAISGDGRRIAFQSLASDLTCATACARGEVDPNLLWDVFVNDRWTGRTLRADGATVRTGPSQSLSLDEQGRVLAFASEGHAGATDVETGGALLVPEGWRER